MANKFPKKSSAWKLSILVWALILSLSTPSGNAATVVPITARTTASPVVSNKMKLTTAIMNSALGAAIKRYAPKVARSSKTHKIRMGRRRSKKPMTIEQRHLRGDDDGEGVEYGAIEEGDEDDDEGDEGGDDDEPLDDSEDDDVIDTIILEDDDEEEEGDDDGEGEKGKSSEVDDDSDNDEDDDDDEEEDEEDEEEKEVDGDDDTIDEIIAGDADERIGNDDNEVVVIPPIKTRMPSKSPTSAPQNDKEVDYDPNDSSSSTTTTRSSGVANEDDSSYFYLGIIMIGAMLLIFIYFVRQFTETCSFQYSRVSTADPYNSSQGGLGKRSLGTSLMEEDDDDMENNRSRHNGRGGVEMTKFSKD